MVAGIVEIAQNDRYVSLKRGLMVVSDKSGEVGRVPLADVTALVISAPQATLSRAVMESLASQNTIIIVCGSDYLPLSITLPYATHYDAPSRIRIQVGASVPLQKRLWQRIIQEKIANQSLVLSWIQPDSPLVKKLAGMVKRVRSGDPDNVEAQAARQYWSTFFGPKFSRNRQLDGENAFLNYTYTILRSATARAVVATGLLPAIGLHHKNKRNAFALVDDLMEPFRPLADMIARQTYYEKEELSPEAKSNLASLLTIDVQGENGIAPLFNGLHQMAYSLVKCLEEKNPCLEIPQLVPPNTDI